MRRSHEISLILLLLGLVGVAYAQRPVAVIFHAAEAGNVNGTAPVTDGFTMVAVQSVIADAGDATLNLEGSQDTSTYVAVMCRNLATFAYATTATGNVVLQCDISGLRRFRVRTSGTTQGSVTVTGYLK